MKIHIKEDKRSLKTINLGAQLVIVGGGLSGTCAAITAAREGLNVVLVQDRPILGGNASSEVRLWALGATSHMGNNNRWSREGGVIDEIVVENLHRNPEGNPVVFDAVLLDKVFAEKNITLLLDTAVFHVQQNEDGSIGSVRGFCSQNSTMYNLKAPLFCDASGDGILGYLSGASYRVGAEGKDEFNEPLAPNDFYGELLGHTIYFYSKDTGEPVEYIAPEIAMNDISKIPRFNRIKASDSGCSFWWLEYGGRMDTVHESQEIKKELWKVTYGIWNYIKNSGNFPEAENLTLEWVGMIPGKRESRRFEGDYMLRQQDIVDQKIFDDAVSFGGWAMDLHPADGVYSELSPCHQYHSKGVYQIPWRCLYSRDISNLLLSGRLISASHVAFGSTRVMMTSAHNAQASAVAAALCTEKGLTPRELGNPSHIRELQKRLLRTGQYIPFLDQDDEEDLISKAGIKASSAMKFRTIPGDGTFNAVNHPMAVLMPLPAGPLPGMEFSIRSTNSQTIKVQLRKAEKAGNYSPELILEEQQLELPGGTGSLSFSFSHMEETDYYGLITLIPEEEYEIETSSLILPGIVTLYHELNEKVAKSVIQEAPEGAGIHSFEFWLPHRRPNSKLPALSLTKGIELFNPDSIRIGYERPWHESFGWVPDPDDQNPVLNMKWDEPISVSKVILCFDTDFDNAMETVQMGHSERHMPNCVRSFRLSDGEGRVLLDTQDNYQSRRVIQLNPGTNLKALKLEIFSTWNGPPALFRVRVLP